MTPLSLLLSLLLLVTTSLSSPPPPHHNHHHISPPPPQQQQEQEQEQEEQLSNIISTLLSTTDFQSLATLLSYLSPPSLSNLTATVFVPSDSSLSHLPTHFDPLLIPYHILPDARLPLSSLSLLPHLSRLPTLLPNHYILVTNNSVSNFSVNGVLVTRPDLFLSRDFAVHGIRDVMFYSPYFERNESVGNGFVSPNYTRPMESEPEEEEEVEVDVGSVWDSGALKVDDDGFSVFFLIVLFGTFW